MRKLLALSAVLMLNVMSMNSAHAATIIKSLQLDAINFSDGVADTSVAFNLNFDNSFDFSNNTTGVTSIFSPFGPLKIGYSASNDILSIVGGNGSATPGGCGNSAGSFCSFIYNISSATPSSNFFLVAPLNGTFGFAGNVSISVPGAVPEPATWLLMLLGVGFVGGAMRSSKRRQKVTVSYA